MKKISIIFSIITVVCAILLLIGDYCNCLHGDRFNVDFVSCVIGNAVVVLLFIITFSLIDYRNMIQGQNKAKIVKMLLSKTYSQVSDELESVFSSERAQKYILAKIYTNKSNVDNQFLRQFEVAPFTYHEDITTLAKEGVISASSYDDYLNVREYYRIFVNVFAIFYDNQAVIQKQRSELENALQIANNNLTKE